MRLLHFYTTSACHLCELAEAMLQQQSLAEPIMIEAIDISESDALLESYGTRIPVLKFTDSDSELAWPFSQEELGRFLQDGRSRTG